MKIKYVQCDLCKKQTFLDGSNTFYGTYVIKFQGQKVHLCNETCLHKWAKEVYGNREREA